MSPEKSASTKKSNTGKKPSQDSKTPAKPTLDKHTQSLVDYLKAGYPGLWIVTTERQRMRIMINRICSELLDEPRKHFIWNMSAGIVDPETGNAKDGIEDPDEAVKAVLSTKPGTIMQIEDLSLYLKKEEPDPGVVSVMKEVLDHCKENSKHIIITSAKDTLPPELKDEITVIDFGLPDKDTLGMVLDGIVSSTPKLKPPVNGERERIIDAALGLTCSAAENAFALSLAKTKALNVDMISKEKARVVARSGILEIVDCDLSIDDIGGMDQVKSFLLKRKNSFSRKAREFGLPPMKGILTVGIPGTGKSLVSKVAASIFEAPCLRLDMGAVFGGTVGESEGNIRHALNTADAIGKCVLWIDEMDKGFSGVGSSDKSDAGTAARVIQTIMIWSAEKTTPVVIMATANDVSALMQSQPALFRKGRFDQIFFCDLPTGIERKQIFDIHLKRVKRNPELATEQVVRESIGYTGAEIEACVVEALNNAFYEERDINTDDLIVALSESRPMAEQMSQEIQNLRDISKGRFCPASSMDDEQTFNPGRVRSYGRKGITEPQPF